MDKKKISTKSVVMIGMFAAILAVMSQISIPLPSGIPITLQIFAVALTGGILGWRLAAASTGIYIVLGAVGVPVFANLSGGFGIIVGKTGGFIIGFLFLAILCGLGTRQKRRAVGFLYGLAGLLIVHIFGSIQFALLSGMPFLQSAILASVPFLVKDILSVLAALLVGAAVRKRLLSADMIAYV